MNGPLVSIGMPVYNGEKYLRGAIESLLSQSHANIELVISDDASTDGTSEICAGFASRDGRVRYYRQEKNRGITWNFNHVLALARGEYFMWAAQDDLRDKDYIKKCVQVLERDPEASLCASRVIYIGPRGSEAGRSDINLSTRGMGAARRVTAFLKNPGNDPVFYGLIRRKALAGKSLENVMGQDYLLVLELLLEGHIETVPEYLFNKRIGGGSRSIMKMARTYGITSGPIIRWHRAYLFTRFLSAIFRSGRIGQGDKIYLGVVAPYLYLRHYLYHDLADRRQARAAKRLAYLKTHAREGHIILKILILLEMPFLRLKRYVRSLLKSH